MTSALTNNSLADPFPTGSQKSVNSVTVQERRRVRVEMSNVLRDLLDKLGYSIAAFADLTRRSQSIARRLCDPTRDETITLADLLLESVPDEIAIPLIIHVLDARGYSPPKKKTGEPTTENLFQAFSTLTSAATNVVQHFAESLQDGKIDTMEARRFLELSIHSRKIHIGVEELFKRTLDDDDDLTKQTT